MLDKIAKALAIAAAKVALDAIEEAMTEAAKGDQRRARPRSANPEFRERAAAGPSPRTTNRPSPSAWGGVNAAQRPAPRKVSESVTAVLKRQIPIRDEAPRSWIGGLPMLPDDVEWPRAPSRLYADKGEIPLNFFAQIACADLPPELWGGLGPREGWLLFFAPIYGDSPRSDFADMRVLHTRELGKERPAPPDKQLVADMRYSGQDYAGVIFRRCPVDIVCMSNAPVHPVELPFCGAETGSPMPDNLTQVLYGDAPVGPSYWRDDDRPFNWASLALALTDTLESLDAQCRKSRSMAEFRRKLAEERAAKGERAEPKPGSTFDAEAMERALEAMRAEEDSLATVPSHLDAEGRERRKAHVLRRSANLAEQRALIARFGDPFDADAFADFLEQEQAARDTWLTTQADRLRDLIGAVSARPPYEPIDETNWGYLEGVFSTGHDQWFLGHIRDPARSGPLNQLHCPEKSTLTLRDIMKRQWERANLTVARDMYFAGPEERRHLPDDIRARIEASAQGYHHNRPPRMGGAFQPVQDSSAPPGKVLLLQLVNDDAAGINWGDTGALFGWIGIDALERGDFSTVDYWTENT